MCKGNVKYTKFGAQCQVVYPLVGRFIFFELSFSSWNMFSGEKLMNVQFNHLDMIKAIRMAEGLNQSDFAKRLNVAQGTISKLESQKFKDVTFSLICDLAEIFDVNINDFLDHKFHSYKFNNFKQKLVPKKYLKNGFFKLDFFSGESDFIKKILISLKVSPLVLLFSKVKVNEDFLKDFHELRLTLNEPMKKHLDVSCLSKNTNHSSYSIEGITRGLIDSKVLMEVKSKKSSESEAKLCLRLKSYKNTETIMFIHDLVEKIIDTKPNTEILSFETIQDRIEIDLRC